MSLRRLEAFAHPDLEPDCVAVRISVAEELGLHSGEGVFVGSFHDPASRIMLPSWTEAAEGDVGPDGCLVAPELLERLDGLAADRLVVLQSARPPLPCFYTLAWTVHEPETQPRPEDVVVLLDASSSMDGAPLRQAKRALLAFVDQKREAGLGDRLGLVTFGGDGPAGVEVVCRPRDAAAENQAFVDGVLGVRPAGLTPMAAALRQSMELMQELDVDASRRRRLVLVTDGYPCPGSADEIRDLAPELADAGVRVATVGVGGGFDRGLLSFLAARTGAPFLEAHSIRQLPVLLEALAAA